MNRRARLDFEGYYYHIMCRGQRKQSLFFSDEDMEMYLKILKKVMSKHDCEVCAYCLMRNHVHLLIKRNSMPLYTFMHRLNTKYALYFNTKYNTVGHVFQDRYKSKIILNEEYLGTSFYYILNNPVKAGYCETPEDYRFSSVYKDKSKKETEIPIKELRGLKPSAEEMECFRDSIGTEEEYLALEKRLGVRSGCGEGERRKEFQSIKHAADHILQDYDISLEDVIMNKNKFSFSLIRKILVSGLVSSGYKKKEIAELLGYSRSAISKMTD